MTRIPLEIAAWLQTPDPGCCRELRVRSVGAHVCWELREVVVDRYGRNYPGDARRLFVCERATHAAALRALLVAFRESDGRTSPMLGGES